MSLRRLPGNSRFFIPVALIAALGLGAAWQRSGAIGEEPRKEVNPAAKRHAEQLSDAFHDAAEIAMPTVVTIRSKTKSHPVAQSRGKRGERGENPFKGTPFEDFFNGRNLEDLNPRQMPGREGMGSGVIIDRSGLVLTNNHVVDGAEEVTVHLADGREFKGEDIKTDKHTDLAIIRIKGAGTLPAATLGDSDHLRIGDWVMAIGNPFELEQTVSAGIISGVGRELRGVQRAKFLQTDAAINPGNSGGPLVNLNGEVIGINTAIATNNGSFAGIGFAIPINQAKWVTTQLIKQGAVQRAYLGVQLQAINPEVAEGLGTPRGEGVLVSDVFPNTPASAAGFEAGDVITKFDGHKVKNGRDLQELVERAPLDSKSSVEVLRDGRSLTLSVTAKAMPESFGSERSEGRPGRAEKKDSSAYEAEDLGIEVTELTNERAAELGFEGRSGVVITKVDQNGPAYERGLREGMLVMKVAKQPVKNVSEFKTALKGASLKDGILFHVRTQEGSAFVVVKE